MILTTMLLVSCSSPVSTKQQMSVETPIKLAQNEEGTGIKLTEKNATTMRNWTFNVPDTKFQPQITIYNSYPMENPYYLVFFLDYIQLAVQYEGDSKKIIDFALPARAAKEITVTIPGLTEGLHDLLVLAIRKPNEHLEKNSLVAAESIYVAHRINIIVGKPELLIKKNFVQYSAESVNYPFTFAITKQKLGKEPQYLLSRDGIENHDLWINFKNTGSTRYALITLINYNQVDYIQHPFIDVINEGTASVPFKIKHLESNVDHEFTIIVIQNPWQIIEDPSGKVTNNLIR